MSDRRAYRIYIYQVSVIQNHGYARHAAFLRIRLHATTYLSATILTYQCLVWPGFGLARLLASSTAAATGDFSHKTSYSQKSERAVGFSRKKHRLSYDTHMSYTYPGRVMTVPFHLRRAHPQHDMRKRFRRRLTVRVGARQFEEARLRKGS
jgi:hypothetical protein